MSPIIVGAVTFAGAYGAALVGLFISDLLPKHHVSSESRTAVNISIAMVGTLTALVIGLLVSSAHGSFSQKETELRNAAAKVILLDRTLREYHPPDNSIRDFLRQTVVDRIHQLWPEVAAGNFAPATVTAGNAPEDLRERILALSPENDAQRWLKSQALDITSEIEALRWQAFERIGGGIQWPFVAIVVFWLAVIYLSFGLFAPRNASVLVALFLSALSFAGAIYLLLALDRPYSAPIKLSSAALQMALEQIQKP
jgi:hypothetical protein